MTDKAIETIAVCAFACVFFPTLCWFIVALEKGRKR